MANYAAIKARIFGNQRYSDMLILNATDTETIKLEPTGGPAVYKFSREPFEGEGVWITGKSVKSRIKGNEETLFDVSNMKIRGAHNAENACAAALAGLLAGVDSETIKSAVAGFAGLEHRMEKVDEINAVSYYNDSKGTNPEATIKSLEGFNKNVVLIAGGSSKGSGFTSLAGAIFEHAKGVALIGQTAPEIEKALGSFQPKVRARDMKEAVSLGASWCGEGDAVLLSPACASFDMYENFEKRGEAFKKAVAGLRVERKDAN